MEPEPPAVFNKKFWAGKLMEAGMEHPELKVPSSVSSMSFPP